MRRGGARVASVALWAAVAGALTPDSAQVNAYRKLQKRLGAPPSRVSYEEGEDAGAEAAEAQEAAAGEADAAPRTAPKGPKRAKFNALEALAKRQAAERRAADEAAAQAAAEAQQRQRQRDEAAHARRRTAEAMRKRNARGQPVMRYRVDAILAKLQAESKPPR